MLPPEGHPLRPWLKGVIGLVLAGLFAQDLSGAPLKVPSAPASSSELRAVDPMAPSPLDRLIDSYRQASGKQKVQLCKAIAGRITEEATGRQELAVQEAIKLSNLKRAERRNTKRSHRKVSYRSHRRRRSCRSLQCLWRQAKSKVSLFFHKATQKRRHPLKKPNPRTFLKSH